MVGLALTAAANLSVGVAQAAPARSVTAQPVAGDAADAPDPGAKRNSPEVDLVHYPKLTQEQLKARVARDVRAQATAPASLANAEVSSVERTTDGLIVTRYTAAPGVTPEQLAEKLRKTGKQGVSIDRMPATSLAPSDCSYGTAHSWSCPVAYWRNNGFADPLVRFNDHASSAWPTDNAVYKWNQTPNIDSKYLWNSCPFQAGARCVDVRSGDWGTEGGWIGSTELHLQSGPGGPFVEQGAVVQLNDAFVPDGTWTRNNVVTHELGHVLGLDHNSYSGDVLYYLANLREDIGGQNPAMLASIYSITR